MANLPGRGFRRDGKAVGENNEVGPPAGSSLCNACARPWAVLACRDGLQELQRKMKKEEAFGQLSVLLQTERGVRAFREMQT